MQTNILEKIPHHQLATGRSEFRVSKNVRGVHSQKGGGTSQKSLLHEAYAPVSPLSPGYANGDWNPPIRVPLRQPDPLRCVGCYAVA